MAKLRNTDVNPKEEIDNDLKKLVKHFKNINVYSTSSNDMAWEIKDAIELLVAMRKLLKKV